jgi:hypothetical protein
LENTQPLWGHPLRVWDTGQVIRVPQYVFPLLRQRGLLIKNKPILSPRILQDFDDSNLQAITHELKMVLGSDLSGPMQVKCRCRECQERNSDVDHTRLPGLDRLEQDEASRIVREVKARRHG